MKVIFNVMDNDGNTIEEYIFNGNPDMVLIGYVIEDLVEEFKDKGAVTCKWEVKE